MWHLHIDILKHSPLREWLSERKHYGKFKKSQSYMGVRGATTKVISRPPSPFLSRAQSFLARHKYLVLILLLAVAARIIWLKLTLNPDEGELGYDAMLWSRGEIPYSLRLSEKPPLAYLMYMALTFLGNTVIPARILNDVLFFISIIAFYLLVKKWSGKSVSLVASFLYVFSLSAPALWGPFATSAYLSMPFTIFSLLACVKYLETSRIPYLITSGILLSVAGLIRLNCFVVFVVLLVILTLGKERLNRSTRKFLDSLTANILILLFGVSIPLLFVVTSFWASGALEKMINNVLIRVVVANVPILMGQSVDFDRLFLGFIEALPLMVLTILGCFASILVRRRGNLYAITWLLVQLPLFALGPHDFYHLAVIVPPGAILSAFVLCLSFERLRNLKSRSRFSKMPSYRVYQAVLSMTLVFLFVPSIYFQTLQFPSGNMYLDSYSQVGSYDQTMALATYLKSLNVKDGQVLIQYWLPYVYWLTGIRAPSIHLDTYTRGTGIPLEEYSRLFAEVKERKVPYVIVVSWVVEGADPITDFARTEYFPLKSIGGVDVYSVSYPAGVFFSFVAKLHETQAYGLLPNGTERRLDEMNNSVVAPMLQRVTINDETEYAIRQHPLVVQSNITYSNIQIPSNATLEFNIALDQMAWTKSDGVLFQIFVQCNGQTDQALFRYVDPKKNVQDRKRLYYEIPLEKYGNRTISISFITNPGPANDSSWDWAYWGNPLIRQIP